MEPVSFILNVQNYSGLFSLCEKHMKAMKNTVQVNNNFVLFFVEQSSKE